MWPTLVDGIISHLETTDVARVSAALYLFEVNQHCYCLHCANAYILPCTSCPCFIALCIAYTMPVVHMMPRAIC